MQMLTPWNVFGGNSSLFGGGASRAPQKMSGPALLLSHLNQEMEQAFDKMMRNWEEMGRMAANTLIPHLKVEEKDKAYEFIIQLPDFEQEDLEVSVQGGMLTIYAEVNEQEDQEGMEEEAGQRAEGREGRHREEGASRRRRRPSARISSFYQSIPLPVGVNSDEIEAEFHNGELILTVPKLTESLKPRMIEINSEDSGSGGGSRRSARSRSGRFSRSQGRQSGRESTRESAESRREANENKETRESAAGRPGSKAA